MDTCTICFENSGVTHKLPCHHRFHANCIIAWFRSGSNTCPVCQDTGGYGSVYLDDDDDDDDLTENEKIRLQFLRQHTYRHPCLRRSFKALDKYRTKLTESLKYMRLIRKATRSRNRRARRRVQDAQQIVLHFEKKVRYHARSVLSANIKQCIIPIFTCA